MTDDIYLRGPAVESARQRITEYREKRGWDTDTRKYPEIPFNLLVEILMDVHHAVENALLPGDDERFDVLAPWLLFTPQANPAWAPEVLRTVKSFASQGFDLPAGGVENLQRLFDAGREAGADQELMQKILSDVPNIRDFTREPTMKQCRLCSGATYAGEPHYCRHDQNQAKAQSFRSFGDRRP